MCGIAGFWEPLELEPDPDLARYAASAARSLAHRGPDETGTWIDAERRLALAHTRLAVIDTSPAGRQPMASADGRFTIVYNGEIYNHRSLRRELQSAGHAFRGHSDTETLLASIERWGLDRTLERINGMFAFALWDSVRRELSLARDRFGEKPLYYGWIGRCFAFGSELKAMRGHPSFGAPVRRDVLAGYLRLRFVPAPHTIHEGVHKLPPAHVVTLGSGSATPGALPRPRRYWSLTDAIARGLERRFDGTDAEATERLERLLREAVRERLESDVPLGAFLSGGVDSSLVVALMQAESSRPIRTFTVGHDGDSSEAAPAAAIARHLGTDHTELHVSAAQARELIPKLPFHFDEPFADPSEVPTMLIAEMTRRFVTVALSGDGGDETFAGYDRVVWGRRIWNRARTLPRPIRALAGRALRLMPHGLSTSAARLALRADSSDPRIPDLGTKIDKLASLLPARDADEMYLDLLSVWKNPGSAVIGGQEVPVPAREDAASVPGLDFTERMLAVDLSLALPDDMLVKVDRASMAFGLEVRAPLLDPSVVEFAWRLPLASKIRGGRGKWILREVLRRFVPDSLVDRPKTGFVVPIGDWLRGPMRDWAEELLGEGRLRADGYFVPSVVRACWSDHLGGRRDRTGEVWAVLMFQAWLDSLPARGAGFSEGNPS